ncbi:MAG TPA: lysylphosphatidylglycerol synthase transmembrane domain-containing protein [Mycobacterium sp.]|nr:lysylphosphatidylglycerol synthase transmembrane domain-containing protein [Mycobacterium sp.]
MPAQPRRFRRATDGVLLAISVVVLIVCAAGADEPPSDAETALGSLLSNLPGILQPVWQISFDLLQVWAVVLLVLALARRRWRLARDLVAVVAAVAVAGAAIGRLATGEWPQVLNGLGAANDPIDFPSLALAVGAGAVAVAAPYLARPLRYLGRWLVVLGWLAAVAVEVLSPGGALGALALGWAAAAFVHLLAGSPGGQPSLSEVREELRAIGIEAEPHSIRTAAGVAHVTAKTPDGIELDVRVYGRDAWDSQLVVKLWRLLWYRSGGPDVALTRRQQIEHVAFLTLLAERRGVAVAPVIAAVVDERGDALLVVERVGPGLGDAAPEVDDAVLSSCWRTLVDLHAGGIRHGAIAPEHLQLVDAAVHLSDFDLAVVGSDAESQRLDQAQLLATTAVVADIDRATAVAREALGDDGLAAVTPYVQPAALTASLRRQAAAADIDVDALRKNALGAIGGQDETLQPLRRFSLGRLVMGVLLLIVAVTLVSALQNIGVDAIVDAIQAASVPVLIVAFLIGQTPRLANAVSLAIAAPLRIPLPRLAALQYAITFINLAVPSTAARVAVGIRFFQRCGLDRTSAITVGALDSFAGFVAQIGLILTILLFGLGTLDLNLDETLSYDAVESLLIFLGIVLVLVIAAAMLIPSLRRLVSAAVHLVRTKIWPMLASPRRLIGVLAANVVVELLFSLCSYLVLASFGQDVAFADVILVNEAVAIFAGIMPVPGGMGVTEAALTAGYTAMGVDSATAVGAAIMYRIITFYLPPVIGYPALKSLRRDSYL